MNIAIDFGGSTIDVVWIKKNVLYAKSFERDFLHNKESLTLDKVLETLDFSPEKIFVTGGKSRFLPDKFQGLPIVKIFEIEAIGKGGLYFLQHEKKLKNFVKGKVLVVSIGTGTCMVCLDSNLKIKHVGGTGVSGGTFLGLSKSLLNETNIPKLKNLFKTGDKNKVDILVQDIVGSGIGVVPGTATAANLAKLSKEIKFNKADLALGIANLVGQTIGIIATFAAKAEKCDLVLLTGKLTRIEKILEVILEVGKIYGIKMFVPKKADFVSAIGAFKK